jgi:hypothetical protein
MMSFSHVKMYIFMNADCIYASNGLLSAALCGDLTNERRHCIFATQQTTNVETVDVRCLCQRAKNPTLVTAKEDKVAFLHFPTTHQTIHGPYSHNQTSGHVATVPKPAATRVEGQSQDNRVQRSKESREEVQISLDRPSQCVQGSTTHPLTDWLYTKNALVTDVFEQFLVEVA